MILEVIFHILPTRLIWKHAQISIRDILFLLLFIVSQAEKY